jgi:hypothetical protein
MLPSVSPAFNHSDDSMYRPDHPEVAMPASYFTMWGLLILMVLGAVGGLLVHGNVWGSIRDAYPADVTRRDALRRCGEMDAAFSRFSEDDRQNCYRTILPASATESH